MRLITAPALRWCLIAVLAGCTLAHIDHQPMPKPGVPTAAQPWDYKRQDYWPGICNTGGTRQSPIDFREASISAVLGNFDLRFHGSCKFSNHVAGGIVPDRHGFILADPKLSCAVEDPTTGEAFDVTELHIHYGAEHILEDGPGDFESHLVCVSRKSPSAKLVVATVYRVGERAESAANSAFEDIFRSAIPNNAAADTSIIDLLPKGGDPMLYYSGGLTTPPCTETVQFVVMSRPVIVARTTVRELKDAMQKAAGAPYTNNREIQAPSKEHHVKLLNSGGYVSWALFNTEHEGRKIVLVVALFMVMGGIGLLLYFNRDHGDHHHSHYQSVPDVDDAAGAATEMRPIAPHAAVAAADGGSGNVHVEAARPPPSPAPAPVDGDAAATASPMADAASPAANAASEQEQPAPTTGKKKKHKHVSYGTL